MLKCFHVPMLILKFSSNYHTTTNSSQAPTYITTLGFLFSIKPKLLLFFLFSSFFYSFSIQSRVFLGFCSCSILHNLLEQ
ncbi:hypothetical protein QVD17_11401 [Tagetes erecta]|uniref:Uncharacterized protein n=1 Tax=Tagetes erecta TaxID=13708 RepID=A0AAD8P243_TARER|nr:hypothetical protein QVD17_11401 [Tagetes erecta]